MRVTLNFRKIPEFLVCFFGSKISDKNSGFIKMTIFDQVQFDPFGDPDFWSEFGDLGNFKNFWSKIGPKSDRKENHGPKLKYLDQKIDYAWSFDYNPRFGQPCFKFNFILKIRFLIKNDHENLENFCFFTKFLFFF